MVTFFQKNIPLLAALLLICWQWELQEDTAGRWSQDPPELIWHRDRQSVRSLKTRPHLSQSASLPQGQLPVDWQIIQWARRSQGFRAADQHSAWSTSQSG